MVEYPLHGLAFSDCGGYVHGFRLNYSHPKEQFIVRKVSELISLHSRGLAKHKAPAHGIDTKDKSSTHQEIPRASASTSLSASQNGLQLLAQNPTPPTLNTDAITFSKQDNKMQVSILRKYHDESAVILHRVREDGTVVQDWLTRLPKNDQYQRPLRHFIGISQWASERLWGCAE